MSGRVRWNIAATSLTIAVFVTAVAPIARAAAPVVDFVYPAGGRQGTTFTLTVGPKGRGDAKLEPWPAKVWIDCPGIEFTPQEANSTFSVKIAPDAPPGPHLIRVYNAEGASAPRVFVVGRHAEAVEQEPNDESNKPQVIEAHPAAVNGRLDKAGDVDSFGIDVEAGRWLVAELACWRLGSPVDPALRLLDPDGNEVAFNHDTFGFDPLAAHRAAKSGRYVVQVVGFDDPPSVNVGFSGSRAAVYRLLLTTGPYARYSLPLGVRRGEGTTTLRLFGWNLPGEGGRETSLPFDATKLPPRVDQAWLDVPQIDNALPLPVDDGPESTAAPDTPLPVPASVSGRIERPGGAGRIPFKASKGQKLTFATSAGPALGLPVDPVVTIDDASGKQLARADQGEGSSRSPLEWTAPADGTYVASVADRNHGGGGGGGDDGEFAYRLEIKPVTPDFRATIGDAAVRLEAGKSADVKVTVARRGGHDAPLGVVVAGLPDGVTATTPGASASAGSFTVTLAAKPAAAAANVPLQLMLVSADESRPDARRAAFDLPAGPMVRTVPNLWLTVVPAPPPPATQPATKPADAK